MTEEPALPDIGPIDIRPGLDVLFTFRHYGYKPWFALAEFVDNSVSSFLSLGSDGPLVVEIHFGQDGLISVSDNAAGIQAADFGRALLTAAPPVDDGTLHQFGLGLKTAAFWWGRQLKIETWPIGSRESWKVEVDLRQITTSDSLVLPRASHRGPEDEGRHGTCIQVADLWPERALPTGRTLGKVRSYLTSIYRTYLRSGQVRIVVQGRELVAHDPPILTAPRWDDRAGPDLEWRKDFSFTLSGGEEVAGWVALFERGDTENAGLVLTWRGKAIVGAGAGADEANDAYRPSTVYGSTNSFESQRIFGELDVSAFPVTSRKDGLEWTDEQQQELAERLKVVIDADPLPLIRMARRHRVRASKQAAPVEVDRTEHAVQRLGLALNQLTADPPADERVSQPANADALIPTRETVTELVVPLQLPLPGVDAARVRLWWGGELEGPLIVTVDERLLSIGINLGNGFLVNFAQMPEFQIEPVLRVLTSLAIAQIQAESEGVEDAARITEIVNFHLSRALGQQTLGDTGEET